MGKCKDCKYWNVDLTEENSCDKVNHYRNNFFTIKATADDDSGLTANLITSPEFGCNQFEAKEIKNG